MKKILLTAALACLLGSSVHAQYAQPAAKANTTQKTTHRRGLSFRKATEPKQTERTASIALPPQETKALKRAALAPKELLKHDFLPYDTLLCTGHIRQQNGKTVLDQQIEYDEYGLYRMFTSVAEDGKTETRYTYRIGIANYWTSRLIEKRVNGGSWMPWNKEERTINDQEQLTSVKQYLRYNDGKIRLTYESEYDYSHEFVREDKTHRGARTRYVEYQYERNSDGTETCTPECEENYVWFEPAKDYICTLYRNDNYEKETTEFDGNNTVTSHYRIFTDGDFLDDIVTRYYGQTENGLQIEGYLNIHYLAPNEIQYTEGYKKEYKGLSPHGKIVQGQDYKILEYKYNDRSMEWSLKDDIDGHWLNNNLLEIYSYKGKSYRLYDKDININPEEHENYDVEYDSELQQFTVYYGDMYHGEYGYMNVYDLQNRLVARYRQQIYDLGLCQKGFSEIFANDLEFIGCKISEWKDGQWQPRTEPIQVNEYYEGKLDERGFYHFNEKGELAKVEWYAVTPENPEGTLEEQYIYTYKENEITEVKTFNQDGAITDPTLNKTWLKRLANGNYEYASLNNEYGYYYLFDVAQGYAKIYHKNIYNGEWYEGDCKYIDLVSIDPETGIETRISREYDRYTKQPVYTYKTERLDIPETGYHLEAEYTWETGYNAWEGRKRYITEPRQKNLPILPVRYPRGNDDFSHYPSAPQLSDYHITHYISPTSNHINPTKNYAEYNWKWHEDENGQTYGDWDCINIDFQRVIPMENGGYYIEIQKTDGAEYNMFRYWVELNDQQQIVKLQNKTNTKTHYWDYQSNSIYIKEDSIRKDIELTYNDQGWVTEWIEFPYKQENQQWVKTDDVWKDLYIYTAAQVTPTEIDEVKTLNEAFTLNGREISTDAQTLITVYDLSGRQVTAGTGHLTLPDSGIYLIHCNGQTVKVCCK